MSETGQELTIVPPAALEPMSAAVVPAQARTDAELVGMWLHGRGPATTRAYAADAAAFLGHVGKTLRAVTLGDVQGFVIPSPGARRPAGRGKSRR